MKTLSQMMMNTAFKIQGLSTLRGRAKHCCYLGLKKGSVENLLI